jgi:nitroimidazol reductase NimA-like FMN-containing flavoprotein (pyridoxamine 5'-phosphate oxidase superfamily)
LRGHYEKDGIYDILDEGFFCHVGIVPEGDTYPTVIPMVYGRSGDSLYLHGHAASRLLRRVDSGVPLCITVTHIDGLVYARSLFHSSVNYRSVVLYGKGKIVDDPVEQEDALKVIVEHVMPGRWEDARDPSMQELILSSVVKVEIESASAKIREGPPIDDKADIRVSQIWAGVLPLKLTAFDAQSAPDLIEPKPPIPSYVMNQNRFKAMCIGKAEDSGSSSSQ